MRSDAVLWMSVRGSRAVSPSRPVMQLRCLSSGTERFPRVVVSLSDRWRRSWSTCGCVGIVTVA
eukprot:6277528-Pyramimonas_sp.AAC.1